MSSIPTKHIDGDVAIGRHVSAGGDANIQGNVRVHHNLVVKGWLDAPNIKGPLKGLYASEESLNEAYPHPQPGWYALVGDTLPAAVYRVEGGKWVATGEEGGEFTLYLEELESEVGELTDEVGELTDEVRDIEDFLDNGILLGKTIEFTSTGTVAAMKFSVLKSDGSNEPYSKPIPIVTSESAGMMSAADKKKLLATTSEITALNDKIRALETKTAQLIERLSELDGVQVFQDDNYLFAITDSMGTLLLGIEKSGHIVQPQGQVQMMSREQYTAIEPKPDTLYIIKGHNGMTEGAYINGETLNTGEAFNFYRDENIIKYRGGMKSRPYIYIDHETMEAKIDYPSDYEGPMIVNDPETKTLFVI